MDLPATMLMDYPVVQDLMIIWTANVESEKASFHAEKVVSQTTSWSPKRVPPRGCGTCPRMRRCKAGELRNGRGVCRTMSRRALLQEQRTIRNISTRWQPSTRDCMEWCHLHLSGWRR